MPQGCNLNCFKRHNSMKILSIVIITHQILTPCNEKQNNNKPLQIMKTFWLLFLKTRIVKKSYTETSQFLLLLYVEDSCRKTKYRFKYVTQDIAIMYLHVKTIIF